MADIPVNQRLWNVYVSQAKAKFRVYPSPAAAHWVHQHYVQAGGRFVQSVKDQDKGSQQFRKEEREKEKSEKRKGR